MISAIIGASLSFARGPSDRLPGGCVRKPGSVGVVCCFLFLLLFSVSALVAVVVVVVVVAVACCC